MSISSFLNREYYFPKTRRLVLLIPVGYSLVILLILLLFTPFGMHNIKTIPERFIVAAGYSCLTFIVWFCALKTLLFFKINQIRSWHILFFILLLQILTGILCTVYNNIIFSNPHYLEFLLDFQFFVLLTGILPAVMLLLFLETSFYKKQFLKESSHPINSSEKNGERITIEDENPDKNIELLPSEIISIHSMDNYIRVELQKNGERTKPVIQSVRKTLSLQGGDVSTKLLIFDVLFDNIQRGTTA